MLSNFKVIDIVKTCGDSTVSFSEKLAKFNKSTASEMHYPPFVRMLINTDTKQFAVQTCKEEDANALKFSKPVGQHYAISVYNRPILEVVRRLMEWSPDETFKCYGAYFPDANAMIYDLSKAVIIERKGKDDDEVDGTREDE